MWIDKSITNTKYDILIGIYASLKNDDKNWLKENGYKIEKWCNGVLFRIKVK